MTELQDEKDRLLAVTTFDRNVVVTAGAGTGKTTLLIDRITCLLMRDTDPLRITDIIAITFTKKAANEMKVRLRNRLRYFMQSADGRLEEDNYETALLSGLIQRYKLSADSIAQRAEDALNNLEKAQIGTIHSFAGHILRLYPLEAGIAPDIEEDDGDALEGHFEREWDEWIDDELSAGSPRSAKWKDVLRRISIDCVKVFARCLCRETIPLSSPEDEADMSSIVSWLEQEKAGAQEIFNRYKDSKKVKMQGLLQRTVELLDNAINGNNAETFNDSIPSKAPLSWDEDDYREAVRIVSVAQYISATDEEFIKRLNDLIVPFALLCRKKFVSSGNISFDGLIAFCCNLLKNKQNIRNNLKNKFKSILIDEFQDTDPLQYEIALYLAEDEGSCAKDWRELKLSPGKLFIVGDPKQSIYAFRGADIGAYHRVVDMIEGQGGVIANLSTNFRSHDRIIGVVNSVCRRIINRRDNIQPDYVDINACPGRKALKPLQRVEMRLIDTRHEDDRNLMEAAELEAMALGMFLKEEMIGKEIISDTDGSEAPVSPRHVAILFPKLTQVHEYLDVLKRLGIPYIVEGDRHFYGTQEVIDFVNILRVLDNPLDETAMCGVLRSPLGGVSDRELYELSRLSLLDYRIEAARLKEGLGKVKHSCNGSKREDVLPELIPALYDMMKQLSLNVSMLPVTDAIHYIFNNSPVLELAASSYFGEQSVANLLKVHRIAASIDEKSSLTLKGLTVLLEKKVALMEKEGESLLSEEGVDAVRILSIHRAKGLEFPVVAVAGLHGRPNRRTEAATVTHDWSRNMTGISVAGVSNYSAVMMQDKDRLIEQEEMKRLLYVAMTRARECLILSGVLGKRVYRDSFLSILMDSMGPSAGDSSAEEVRMDDGILKQTIIDYRSCSFTEPPAGEKRLTNAGIPAEKMEMLSGLWKKREKNYRAVLDKPNFVTPSLIEKNPESAPIRNRRSEYPGNSSAGRAILIGNIVHYILSEWDFTSDAGLFKNAVGEACKKYNTDASIQSELEEIFEIFSDSSAYEEIKGAAVLGREIPFTIPWDGQVMEGVIDILYRCGDNIYAADYKTDRLREDEITSKIREYSVSVNIYRKAVKMCTGSDLTGFKIVFLRNGISVKV